MKDGALNRLRDIVDLGYEVMKFHYDQSQPMESALEALRSLHFQGGNYFFVVQEDLTMVAHGSDRKLEGMDSGKIQDKKTGKTFMREVVENAVKSGESFTEYYWTKPGKGQDIFPKITCAKYFRAVGVGRMRGGLHRRHRS